MCGDGLDGEVCFLQKRLGCGDPFGEQPVTGAGSQLVAEPSSQVLVDMPA